MTAVTQASLVTLTTRRDVHFAEIFGRLFLRLGHERRCPILNSIFLRELAGIGSSRARYATCRLGHPAAFSNRTETRASQSGVSSQGRRGYRRLGLWHEGYLRHPRALVLRSGP